MRYCSHCHTPYGGDERFCPVDGAAVVDESGGGADPLVGRTIAGRYLVGERIGKGGMGAVYQADHVGLGKRVAVKFLLDKFSADPEVLARFHQEARAASRIGHENIVDVIDIGEDGGRSYLVMEYLDGADLARVLADGGRLDPARAIHIIRQILRGLGAAHGKGIVHRDMKPENVFLTRRGDDRDFVKIMDFGISKVVDAHDSKVRLTETGAVIGTPIYMAPEQARAEGKIDHRVDIYAVGVMLHEMLAGEPPFRAQSYLQLVTQHLFDTPPPLRQRRPEVPAAIEEAVLRALAKDPAARPASAAALMALLPAEDEVAAAPARRRATAQPVEADSVIGQAAVAAPTTRPPPVRTRRSLTPWLLVGGAALAAAAMVGWAIIDRADRGQPSAARDTAAPAGADAGTATAAAPAAAEVEPLAASLEIDSRPQGARVRVDGVDRGVTPTVVTPVAPGEHTIRLDLDGYVVVETRKETRSGRAESFFAALAARPAAGRPSSGEPRAATPRRDPERRDPERRDPERRDPERRDPERRPPGGGSTDHKPNPFVDPPQ